jgi:cell division protease FtsH
MLWTRTEKVNELQMKIIENTINILKMSTPRKPSSGGGQKKPGSNQTPDGPQWGKASRSLIFWIGLFVIALLISQQFTGERDKQSILSYNDFMDMLESGKIQSLRVENTMITATQIPDGSSTEKLPKYKIPILQAPEDATLEKWRTEYGVEIELKPNTAGFMTILLQFAPWVLFIGLWIYFLRRMQGGGGGQRGIFNFGKSRARQVNENFPKVTFNDVAGADEAKQELQEIIEFLKEPEKFQKLGGKIPKGALLLGPPGTGKTLLAKAVAGEAAVPFFSMSGADFVEMFVGVGASRVRDLFEQGKKSAPCIIFIDELDAVGRHRGAGLGGGHDEREQTLNQLLVEMDGFEFNEGVILIAATNRPDVLDSALLRPGRFDRQIVVDRPDVRGREGILKVHTRKIPLAKNINLEVLAKSTPGFSGADLANMVNEAALLAARKNKKRVDMSDLEEAKDKVVMGTERKSMLISEKEKESTAYHEAGHVIVGKLTPGADPVHKVTIIPRGRALGATMTLPMDEKHNYSRTYCIAMMRQLLGGRAAEKLIFNEYTTGAGDDIRRSTELARKMVCEWGMTEALGPITYGEKQEEIFLGREIAQHRDYSEETAKRIDAEIRKLVDDATAEVDKLLRDNVDILHRMTKALLERESLDGDEIEQIMNGEELEPVKPKKTKRDKKKSEPKEAASNEQADEPQNES